MSTVRLKKWSVIEERGPYDPPEFAVQCLRGECIGHPKKKDGTIIHTSTIQGTVGHLVKTYSGTLYDLCDVDPEYETLYPNARERFFESQPKLAQ